MLTLLHLSDLHFGPFYLPHVGEALVRFAHEEPSDILVISGDFTQRAKEAQFEEARSFIDSLPKIPLVVTPGNHDIPLYRVFERLLTPYALYQKYISPDLRSVLRHPGATLVSINTTSPYTKITNGTVWKKDLDFCAESFAGTPKEDARIVVAHHHFAPAPDYERSEGMTHGRSALDRFLDMDVELVLGGHLHRAYIGNSLDVHAGKSRDRGVIIVQSGTSTSRRGRGREREKNSLNRIYIESQRIRIVHYLYLESAAGTFVPVSEHFFPRGNLLHL